MEIIKLTDGDLDLYQELLLRRDEVRKEAEHTLLKYTAVFGDITTEIFLIKIECIALKRAISYCVTKKNQGEKADKGQIDQIKKQSMADFQSRVDDMIKKNQIAKNGKQISAFQADEIKRIYRKIAKLLHPDISPVTNQYPELLRLFHRVVTAYKSNSYNEMKELEVLVSAALDKIGQKSFSISILDLKVKISQLEEEIHTIITTAPYIYSGILNSTERTEEQMEEYRQEKQEYLNYKAFLEKELQTMTEE